jgi:AcrR family transcriptional regulator
MGDDIEDADEGLDMVWRRTGGRSARVRAAVLEATLAVLAETGFSGLTFSEIARRSGVHATSIQRRWGSRENVLLDALLAASEKRLPIPNTGSLRGDLLGFANSLAAYLRAPIGEGVIRLMAASQDSAALAMNRVQFFRTRFETARVMLDRAAERGELQPHVDRQLIMELLSAPLYFRLLLTREPLEEAFIASVVETLIRGITK